MSETEKDNSKKEKDMSHVVYNPAFFKGDYGLYLAYRRIENVSAALFLITQDFPDQDTLKMSLRKTCLECVSKILSFISHPKVEIQEIRSLVSIVLELDSIITIGRVSGGLSEMNAGVLQKELRKIEDTLENVISGHTHTLVIDPSIFTDIDLQARHRQHLDASVPKARSMPVATSFSKDAKPRPVTQKPNSTNTSSPLADRQEGVVRKNERRDVILKLLAEKSNLNVKDFSSVITDYSEKTIQRELLALVDEGIIKKQGERRWSTYSLNRE